jgi:CubicO group peptidase (beta-lactamase class C family)
VRSRLCALISVALLATLPRPTLAQQPAGLPAALDGFVRKVIKEWQLPGLMIAVVRNDSVVVARGYGVREIGKPAQVDEHTVFDAASLTKSFTATAVAMLVDEGKMRWDDPVRRYLPEIEFSDPYLTANVTIRDLLAHRTGLRGTNQMWLTTGIDRTEVLRRMRFVHPGSPFRTAWVYSNIGYTVAGEASAAASGTSWEKLIRSRLLDPLGLHDSFLWPERDRYIGGNVAAAHTVIDGKQQAIDPRDGPAGHDGRNSTAPAGAVQLSATDLARWMRFHLGDGTFEGKRLVSSAAMEEMHSPHIFVPTTPAFRASRLLERYAGYGMGWQIWDYKDHPMIWHSGNGAGQVAYMALLPKDRLGVAVVINSWRGTLLHLLIANRIIDTYLGIRSPDPLPAALRADSVSLKGDRDERARLEADRARGTRPSRPLDDYAGTYGDSLFGPVIVRREAGGLSMQMNQGLVADLAHWHYDTFLTVWRSPRHREDWRELVTFALDNTGQPAGLSMVFGRDTIVVKRTGHR